MIEKMVGMPVSAVGVSMGFEPITMLIRERGLTFNSKANLALIYDDEDNIVEVFKAKEELKAKYNVSLFKRAKNMKNFFEKVSGTIFDREFRDCCKNECIQCFKRRVRSRSNTITGWI